MEGAVRIGSVERLRALERLLADAEYVFSELASVGQRTGQDAVDGLQEQLDEAEANVTYDDDGVGDYSEVDDARSALYAFEQEYAQYCDAARRWQTEGSEALLRGRRMLEDVVGDVEAYLGVPGARPAEPSVPQGASEPTTTVAEARIRGFFSSGVMDDQDVRAAVAILPREHVHGNGLSGIEYRNLYRSDGVIGWTLPDERQNRIEIFRHSPQDGPQDRYAFVQTIYHEIGHHVHLRLDAQTWEAWRQLSAETGDGERVTHYARTSVEEDFAESYAFYVSDRQALAAVSPRRDAFMRDVVFRGREYGETAD